MKIRQIRVIRVPFSYFCIMKRIILLAISIIWIAGCSTERTVGNDFMCVYRETTLQRDSATWANLPGDSPATYSYNTNAIRMDSLLTKLCEKGISIKEAWYCPNDAYMCKDAIGPRPVVILTASDSSMLSRGFVQGNNGRLACGMRLEKYRQ